MDISSSNFEDVEPLKLIYYFHGTLEDLNMDFFHLVHILSLFSSMYIIQRYCKVFKSDGEVVMWYG